MALHDKTPTIIHSGSSINAASFTAFTYYQVYVGTAGGTAVVNGITMNLAPSSLINMVVRSLSSVTGDIYLLGDKINVSYGSDTVGGSFTS
jgi:hypothetical protein